MFEFTFIINKRDCRPKTIIVFFFFRESIFDFFQMQVLFIIWSIMRELDISTLQPLFFPEV